MCVCVCVCVCAFLGWGGVGGRFSFSTCNYIRGAARRLLLDQKDILSLVVRYRCLFKVTVEAYRLDILLLGQ